jgi:RNA polymerase sigma-70 factor (ECF subfamily)
VPATADKTACGDDEFTRAVELHRRELLVHCYRMLGSVHDAQDLVQETMTRAWRAFDRYDPQRASVRTWLYHIATNACLNALDARKRRPLPSDVGDRFDDPDEPFVPGFEVPWLQPMPDALLGAAPDDPADLAVEPSRLRLAVVAALQLLSARQRAALVLREVLDVPAAEVAVLLDTTTASVNSALQRARVRLAGAGVELVVAAEPDGKQRAVVDRYVKAFEAADVSAIANLLRDDVVLEMPPMWNWYEGVDDYIGFMARVYRTRGITWRSVPLSANRQPAIAAYRLGDDGAFGLHTVQVFTVADSRVARTTVFQDPDVFALFELASTLPR